MSFGTVSLSAGSGRLLSAHRTETPNVFVGFADDRRLVGLLFLLFVRPRHHRRRWDLAVVARCL